MKLTNQQIDAIINKKVTERNAAINIEREKLEDSKLLKAEALKYFKLLNSLPDFIKKTYIYNSKIDESKLKKDLIAFKKIPFKNQPINCNDLRNSIILASIDSKDLIDLESKLGFTI